MITELNADRSSVWTVMACVIGPVLAIALAATYALWPEFYLEHVLNRRQREYQIVEYITFGAAMLAAIILLIAAVRLWRSKQPRVRLAALAVGIVSLATLFFAGEEISWGQTYLGWRTPRSYREFANETNLHNTDIPVHTAANAFLIGLFFVLPLLWHMRDRVPVPRSLDAAVPWMPEIVCAATAFAWRYSKRILAPRNQQPAESEREYGPFFDQINEHKEMLIAVALLVYAINRMLAIRRLKRSQAVE